MTEVAYVKESITPDNVYIIDNGLTIFQVSFLLVYIIMLSDKLFDSYLHNWMCKFFIQNL